MRHQKTLPLALLAATAIASAMGLAAGTTKAATDETPPASFSNNVTFVLPKDIKWVGKEGRLQTAILFGDPKENGPYGVLYKWYPGNFSKPHFHDQTRWGYVISGTWWVSSANVPDESTTYPMHAGTFVTDLANKVHWDGDRASDKEPAIVLVTGIGPVRTVEVDGKGNALPAGH
jgi:quercetin dioxygenase-like cupin family protein